jgi:glycosyltransferase involved in cell wall biosynthesis
MTLRLNLVGYRYSPAVGGAENYARRLLLELDGQVDARVSTVLTENRTDWLRSLVEGERDQPEEYRVDGRPVVAMARWPEAVRRRLRLLAPGYHLPGSPVPSLMGDLMAPSLRAAVEGAEVVHNVFMAREAFSIGLLEATRRQGGRFVFTPLRHQRPLGWSSPAFRRLYREADALIALTEGEKRWLVEKGAPADRVHVIGLGPQNDPAASPEAGRRIAGGRPFVLFLGQLHSYKGYKALLAAVALLADLEVEFLFAGPDVRGHSRLLHAAGPNIRFLGLVSQPERDSLLAACSVLCVPSSRESFGSVVIEAWAAGRPVVGGPAEATRELIVDGVDGFTVAQKPAAIAARLRQLLEDPALADRLGQAGRRKVEQRFQWPALARAHLDVYRSVLERRP